MSEAQLYSLGLGLSLLTGLLVVVYLRTPLHRILVELCGTEERPIHYYLSSMLGRTLFGLLATTAFLTVVIAIFAGFTDSSKGKAGQQA